MAAPPAMVWRVLVDIDQWPSWSSSVLSVTREDGDEQTAYRVEQPPLPSALWTVTESRPGRTFGWQSQGVSSVMSATYELVADETDGSTPGSVVSVDLAWSGRMAWVARAAYGPISIRYADGHLHALRQRCEAGTA